jgi:probable rRNA maturation factor
MLLVYSGQTVVILRKLVPNLSQLALARFAARAARAARLPGRVNVLVTSNRDLQALNRRFRGKDSPTDVLSFPPLPGLDPDLAGDIAISAEMAAQSARALGHPPADEIKILVLHGILHLAGYDHESDHGAMARQEEKLRRELRLPSSLITRNSAAEGTTSARRRGTPRAGKKSASARPPRSTTKP